ncbi:MAG: leucine-rich repeat domain-containing protein [Lachnospiraceae bacterium]|nr:leucine-rich repeat domain-containing protein [Lachnospiraceae bacterium]
MNKKVFFTILSSVGILLAGGIALATYTVGRADTVSEDFQMEKNTLVKYYGKDETCVIPESTKKIASAAFEGNDSVKKIVIPKGVEEIGYNAFAEMSSLERVIIPDNVTKLGASAFANCENLKEVYIGASLCEIGSCPFAGCESLTDLEVSDNNKYLTSIDNILYSADRTVLYEMVPSREKNFYVFPDSVSAISPYAFWGCDNLEHTIVSDSVKVIPPYAFSGAHNLKSVTLSFNTQEISLKAFENCEKLEQVYIPDSVTFISDSAFDGCPKVSLYVSALSQGEKYAQNKELNTIYEPKYDLNLASVLRNEYAADASEKRNEAAKEEEEIYFDISKDDSLGAAIVVNNEAVVLMDPYKIQIQKNASSDNNEAETDFNAILTSNMDNNIIPENLFYLKSDLTEISIPENTKYIGKFAFSRTGLKKVVIPEGVRSVGFGAFYHCDDLSEVIIPDSVTEIEPQAFEKTAWMEEWYKNGESDYLIVGDGILIAYKGKKEDYVKPENVKSVSCDID